MTVLKRPLYRLFLLLFAGSFCVAELPDELKQLVFSGDMFARSSVDFRKKAANIDSVIPKDTKADVLEVRQLRSGAYGIRVRMTEIGAPRDLADVAKVGDENWVYYSPKNPWLRFTSPEGENVPAPDDAATATADKDGTGIPVENSLVSSYLPKDRAVSDSPFAAILPAEGEDPNLAMPSRKKGETEAGVGVTCSGPYCPQATKANQEAIKVVQQKVEHDSIDEIIKKYSNSSAVKKMIDHALRQKSAHSTGYCYRFLKRSLLAAGLVSTRPPGGKASDGVRDLKAQGFVNLLDNPKLSSKMKTPANAPKGALIVYGYPKGVDEAGDIQLKLDEGTDSGYVSDFYSPHSYLHSPKARKYCKKGTCPVVIGVMIKP